MPPQGPNEREDHGCLVVASVSLGWLEVECTTGASSEAFTHKDDRRRCWALVEYFGISHGVS